MSAVACTVGDVRATEMHEGMFQAFTGGEPKWSLGHLCRETFGHSSTFAVGFETFAGSVTAAAGWDQPAHCFALNPGLAGSQAEVLHQALPHAREVHEARDADALLLLFSDRGHTDKGDPHDPWSRERHTQPPPSQAAAGVATEALLLETLGTAAVREARVRALRQACYSPRLMRAVGAVYRPQEERRAHYFSCCLADFVDALLFIDRTEALQPLDVTLEWAKGREEVDRVTQAIGGGGGGGTAGNMREGGAGGTRTTMLPPVGRAPGLAPGGGSAVAVAAAMRGSHRGW